MKKIFLSVFILFVFGCSSDSANESAIDQNISSMDGLRSASSPNDANLRGYWNFNEGSGTIAHDSSGNGNNGTLINGVAWGTGVSGSAINLDGMDDYVSIPDSNSLDISGPFAIMAWVYPRFLPSTCCDSFVNKYFNYILQSDYNGRNAIRTLFWAVEDSQMKGTESGDNTLAINQWQHIASVWDGGWIRIYRNGVEITSTFIGPYTPISSTEGLYIGSEGGNSQYLDGLIDEVKIYNGNLDPSQIMNDYLSVIDLVGYWKFDEGSGSIAFDSSGKGNDGTLINGVARGTGVLGGAADMDGIDDYVSVPDSSTLDIPGPFTISAWVYPRTLASSCCDSFVNKYFNYILQSDYYGTNALRTIFWAVEDSNMHGVESGANTLKMNKWQHITSVWDGNWIRIYRNARQIASAYIGPLTPTASTETLYIGSEKGNSQYLDGLIDEVRIYSRALDEDEIRFLTFIESGFKRGDTNFDGVINSSDIIYLVNYVFKGGPEPEPLREAGDVNCNGIITSADVIYLVNYVFKSGPPPGCP